MLSQEVAQIVDTVALNSWDGFQEEMSRVDSEMRKRDVSLRRFSPPLFRGQADAGWSLSTTLERFSALSYSMEDYHRRLGPVKQAVESLTTGRSWDLPDYDGDDIVVGAPPGYEFMIYLRHHGFPSPLLDWSRSPYVAAFFAFEQPPPSMRTHREEQQVAIYLYVDRLTTEKSGVSGEARITALGPTVVTHERHYSQQCEYTICTKRVGPERGLVYWNHEEAFANAGELQDVLRKYTIPIGERSHFLRKLDLMTINAYSLFRDEGSLARMLAYREIEIEDALE